MQGALKSVMGVGTLHVHLMYHIHWHRLDVSLDKTNNLTVLGCMLV